MNILTLPDSWGSALRKSLGALASQATVISYDRGVWTHQISQDRTQSAAQARTWAELHHHGRSIVVWENAPQKEFTALYQRALDSQQTPLPRLIVVVAPWVQESDPEERKILSLAPLEDPEACLIASFSRSLLQYPM